MHFTETGIGILCHARYIACSYMLYVEFIMILSALLFIVILLLLIGIHEYGHFLAARLCGIKVQRFSIGFGKGLLRWHDRYGTEWVLAVLPLGGYIKLLDEREGPVATEELHLAFNRHNHWQRFLILFAGPLFNFILAIIAFWLMYWLGFLSLSPIIGSITPNSIAARANISVPSQILKIDHYQTNNWRKVTLAMVLRYGDDGYLNLTTKNLKNKKITTQHLRIQNWPNRQAEMHPIKSLGIMPLQVKTRAELQPYLYREQYSAFTAWLPATNLTLLFTHVNLVIIGKLIIGKISLNALGGPISIFQGVTLAKNHISSLLLLIGLISLSLGLINLFPIPGLDGGHILFLIIEAIRGKPLSIRLQVLLYRLGIIFIIVLFVHATMNDITRLIKP